MALSTSYTNLMPLAAFPLGGLGTGSITLHASGALTEFEIFNRPARGNKLPYSFFAIRTAWGSQTDARVLEAKRTPDFDKARGYHPQQVMGLPRFAASRMEVAFPFARIDFEEGSLPLAVALEAFVPFIPQNADDSGIPAASFCYRVKNTGKEPVTVLIAASMPNIYNFKGFDCFDNYLPYENRENREIREDGLSGVLMTGSGLQADALPYADSAILVPEENAPMKPTWYRGGWYDSITDFWRRFSAVGLALEQEEEIKRGAIGPLGYPVGSVGLEKTIAPGDTAAFRFVFSW
ncbi:MAG: GH116 family glycosyl-hydrolase, partial [Bacillota bacterium]